VLDQLGELGGRQVHPGGGDEPGGLLGVHAQIARPDLERQPVRPQRRGRERGTASRRQSQLRARGHVPAELGEGIETLRVMERVEIVQRQDDRLSDRGQRCAQTGDDLRLDRNPEGGQSIEHTWVDRRDPVERGCDVRQQDDRVVVLLVDGDPGERSP